MSLILDALRKSEAERRRGQAPDLHAELPPPTRLRDRRRGFDLRSLAAGAGLLLALAAGIHLLRPTTPTAPMADKAPPARTQPAIAEAQPAPVSEITPAPLPSKPLPAPVPQAEPEPSVPAATVTAIRPADAAPPAPAPASSAPAPTESAPAAVAVATPAPATPVAAAPTAPLSPEVDAPATATDTGLLRLADLSPGEREQLPPLKMSMHMWGPAPAQRFAIVDGTRVGQGDRIGDAVVEEITRDGVVLGWQGRRLLLSMR